ncbi:MBL fold metallo-hydrolase [Candidatus Bathyarchaeota archaeon]|nr:MBL fold metallo-hydrolase [Candidatus Bathyarchaeota archaeon]
MEELRVVFLGTGGGRFVTITQKRRTAGIRLLSDGFNVHLDPGPGGLVYSWKLGLDPQKIDGILVSHAHPDHYNDAEVLVEAMTRGTVRRRGVLAAARSVLRGGETAEVAISKYHQSLPGRVVEVVAGEDFEVGGVRVVGAEARHSDVDAVGFRFETDVGSIGYTSDTEFFEGIERYYKGVRILILCVLRPSGEPWQGHMTTDDAMKIVNAVKPEFAVLTHFGMKMIFQGPVGEAKRVVKGTGVETVAARDGMELLVNDEIVVGKVSGEKRRRVGLGTFFRS